MRRRTFIAGLGSAAAWPMAARAQQPGKLPTIGYLGGALRSQFDAAFFGRLRELGWIDGRNIAIEYRWSEGNSERSAEIASEFVHLKVDVIVAGCTINALAAFYWNIWWAHKGQQHHRYINDLRLRWDSF